jgi:carbonic anhydrase/acetyltransferase-like protein (isoleucine patch superfamily)
VLGAPGKVVKDLTPDHLERMTRSAHNYVKNWQRYRRDLRDDT